MKKSSCNSSWRPHAVMVPLPTPGHMNPMLKLAKILHSKNFKVTYVVTEYTHHCLLRSGEPDPLLMNTLDGFQFVTVSDGLPVTSNREGMKHLEELGVSLRTKFPSNFRDLLRKLNADDTTPVTCVIAGFMSTALSVAEEFGILKVLFWTSSACGFMGTLQIGQLISRGYIPLKDESCLINGYLETELDWIPGMKGVRLKDLTRFIRTTNPNDISLRLEKEEAEIGYKSWGVILNTFDELESDVISALEHMFPRIYTLGPMSAMADRVTTSVETNPVHLNLWKEDARCLQWLDSREPSSVVYVNFGSITILTPDQLEEFAHGLVGSGHSFLWIIRPDLVTGDSAMLTEKLRKKVDDRGFLTSWCSQEDVLAHPSIGGFLTHAGWNSVLESIGNGVPMLCWPFFAEQPTNCRYVRKDWGVGMEIEGSVRREEVERLVRELMGGGEKGMEMSSRAKFWKERAAKAVAVAEGSSYVNLERLVIDLNNEMKARVNRR